MSAYLPHGIIFFTLSSYLAYSILYVFSLYGCFDLVTGSKVWINGVVRSIADNWQGRL